MREEFMASIKEVSQEVTQGHNELENSVNEAH